MIMEEEEDVIFDRAGLLTNHVKPARDVQGSAAVLAPQHRIMRTLVLCGAFLGLGLCMAIPGPTLLDLQQITKTNTEQISMIFTGRSVGYLGGSVLGGLMFDRVNNALLLSVTLFFAAVGTAVAPWSTGLTMLIGLIGFQGVAMGLLDTGGNVFCLQTWGRQSEPYMQGIHFMFGVGAFVAPLLAEPFLSYNKTSMQYDNLTALIPDTLTTSLPTTTTTTVKPTTTLTPHGINWTNEEIVHPAGNETEIDHGINIVDIKNRIKKFHKQITTFITNLTKVQFAYLTVAVFLQFISCMALLTCCIERPNRLSAQNVDMDGQYVIKKETTGFRIQILVLLAIFYFLYVGMEVAYGGLIMTFAVKKLGWSKEEGTLLTSVFWGSFAGSRGVAIFMSRWCSPAVMLIADLVLCALSMLGLLMTIESNPTMLWYCTAVLGIGMASIFPTGITWAERYLRVTGKAASVFVVGSALGEMAIPALAGFLFNKKNPKWLLYIVLGGTIISTVVYIIMQNLATNMGERYQKLMNGIDNLAVELGGNELEMDEVPLSSPTRTPTPIKAPPRNKGTKKD